MNSVLAQSDTRQANSLVTCHQINPGDTVKVGNYRWYRQCMGHGPVCLLLHGTGASGHSWAGLMPLLARHYTTVSIDLPGHGSTAVPANADLSLRGIATAISAFLDHEHLKPVIMIGHSAGAAIMVELCLSHGFRPQRLVSINGALLPLSGLAGWLFSPLAKLGANSNWLPRLFARRAKDPRQVRRLMESTGSRIDATSLRRYEQLFRDPQHVAGVLRMMASWRLEGLASRLPQLSIPIQLIAATSDRTIPFRDTYRLEAILPNATISVIKNKGHLVHEEDPENVAKAIIDIAGVKDVSR